MSSSSPSPTPLGTSTSEAPPQRMGVDRQIAPYYFNTSTSRWELMVAVEGGGGSHTSSQNRPRRLGSDTPANDSPFRVSTFNVLADIFPKPVELVIQSDLRRPHLIKLIEELDATILGLNEVTATILEVILSSPFVRENYYVSETTTKKAKQNTDLGSTASVGQITPTIGAHGCLLLSKIPFVQVWSIDTLKDDREDGREVIVGVFDVAEVGGEQQQQRGRGVEDGKRAYFAVASQHTQAYQTEVNYLKRRTQISNACLFMTKLLSSISGDDTITNPLPPRFVLMGDLNMHYLCEDGFILENGLVDTWAETNFDAEIESFPPGFTYDSVTNKMVSHYVPGENRQMRLDRLLCTPAFLTTFPVRSPCAMWAAEAIDESRDIWPSDHYGLTIDLVASHQSGPTFTPNPAVRVILEENAKIPRDKPTYNMWKFAWALPYHVWFLGKRLAKY